MTGLAGFDILKDVFLHVGPVVNFGGLEVGGILSLMAREGVVVGLLKGFLDLMPSEDDSWFAILTGGVDFGEFLGVFVKGVSRGYSSNFFFHLLGYGLGDSANCKPSFPSHISVRAPLVRLAPVHCGLRKTFFEGDFLVFVGDAGEGVGVAMFSARLVDEIDVVGL